MFHPNGDLPYTSSSSGWVLTILNFQNMINMMLYRQMNKKLGIISARIMLQGSYETFMELTFCCWIVDFHSSWGFYCIRAVLLDEFLHLKIFKRSNLWHLSFKFNDFQRFHPLKSFWHVYTILSWNGCSAAVLTVNFVVRVAWVARSAAF